jgi:hypothetical protein
MGISAYYGESFKNSMMPSYADKYNKVKGAVTIGSFDFEYNARHWIARGYFDYGHLGDSQTISIYNRNLPNQSPSPRTNIASDAMAVGIEAGYDLFSHFAKLKVQKLYLFGRYEQYDSMYKTAKSIQDEAWCGRQRVVAGVNYFPIKEVVVKAEYAAGLLKKPFNNESAVSLGIAYSGFFK